MIVSLLVFENGNLVPCCAALGCSSSDAIQFQTLSYEVSESVATVLFKIPWYFKPFQAFAFLHTMASL